MALIPYTGYLGPGIRLDQSTNRAVTACAPLTTAPMGGTGFAALAGFPPKLPGRSPVHSRAVTPGLRMVKTISGTVLNSGAAVVGVLVRCYVQDTGSIVAETRTDAGGHYLFVGLAASTQYDVLCDPPDSTYNKMVLTRVETPA